MPPDLHNQPGMNRKYLNMSMISHWRKFAAIVLVLAVSACGGAGSSASAPAGGITVTPGNGQVIVTWTADPGVDYWLMYAPTAAAIDIKNPPNGHLWATTVTSPYVVSGLTNGLTYAFAMNGRTGGGVGGAQSVSVSSVPRAAGANWIAGTGIAASSNLRGTTLGISSADSLNYFVAVGDGGAIYKAQDTVTQALNGYAWSLVAPATPIVTDFRAATYALSQYVAVGANGSVNNVFHSTDLVTWTAATTPITTGLNALATNGTTLVAVGDGGRVYTTTDAITWTAAAGLPAGFTSNLYGVAYSSYTGMWVVVGASGALLTSVDAINWTSGSSGVTDNLNGITASTGNVIVAVGDNGTIISNSTMSTTAAGTWSAPTVGAAPGNALYAVRTDSLQFLAVGQGGVAYTSLDGATWASVAGTSTTNDLLSIYGSASKYMIVGKSGAAASSIN
jgi:hypothetical protein